VILNVKLAKVHLLNAYHATKIPISEN